MRLFRESKKVEKLKKDVESSLDIAMVVVERTRSRTLRARSVQDALKKEMDNLQVVMEDAAKINNRQLFRGAYKFQKAIGGIYSFVNVMIPEMDYMQVMIKINLAFREALLEYVSVAKDFCDSVEDFHKATEMDRRLLEEFTKANHKAAVKMKELAKTVDELHVRHIDVNAFVTSDREADEVFVRLRGELGLEEPEEIAQESKLKTD